MRVAPEPTADDEARAASGGALDPVTLALALAATRPHRLRLELQLRAWQPGALVVLDFARGGVAGLGELFVGEVTGGTLLLQSEARMWCGGLGAERSPPYWWRDANAPVSRCTPGDASGHGLRAG